MGTLTRKARAAVEHTTSSECGACFVGPMLCVDPHVVWASPAVSCDTQGVGNQATDSTTSRVVVVPPHGSTTELNVCGLQGKVV
jgi:hypothetical protein